MNAALLISYSVCSKMHKQSSCKHCMFVQSEPLWSAWVHGCPDCYSDHVQQDEPYHVWDCLTTDVFKTRMSTQCVLTEGCDTW